MKKTNLATTEKEIAAAKSLLKVGFEVTHSKGLLIDALPDFLKMSLVQSILLAFAGSLLLTISAKINIPFLLVPASMQTFAVVLLGCVFGARLATLSVALYLAQAFIGFPVLAALTGPAAFVGPTAGYLFGFLPAAFVVGTFFEKGAGRTVASAFLLFVIGAVVIDVFGLTWLSLLTSFNVAKTVWFSYQPAFILKTGLGAVLVPVLAQKLHGHHHHGSSNPPKP